MTKLTSFSAVAATAALLFCSCSGARTLSVPFEPAQAALISEPCNLMSHAPSVEISKNGTVYAAYYRDTTQLLEDGIATTVEMIIDRFKVNNPKKVTHGDFLKFNQTVGDFTQSIIPPYDPALFIDGDKLICNFQGCEKEMTICRRVYDLKTNTFENKIDRCSLSYTVKGQKKTISLSTSGMTQLYRDFGFGEPISKAGEVKPVLSQRFIKGEDGFFYNVISSWCCPQARPVIVRTKDGVNYEEVFVCPEFNYGSVETAIEFVDGCYYVLARSARPEDKSKAGTYFGKYSATGECLVAPYKLGDIESRTALISFKGKLYAFYNASPNMRLPKGKSVHRSRLRISEIDSTAQAVYSWDVSSNHGIQYFNVNEHKGNLYFTFVEDRFERKLTQAKANIAFIKLNM